jgi:hypothetical protein
VVKGVSAGADTIKYRVTNACGSAVAAINITVGTSGTLRESADSTDNSSSGTAVITNNWLKMKAVPNPAKQNLTVSFEAGVSGQTNIRLMDVSGVTIFNKDMGNVQSGSLSIPLGNIASGIYLVELTSGNQGAAERVIKE